MSTPSRVATVVVAALLAAVAAACGGGTPPAARLPGAGPATSPKLTRTPAGTVTHVAPQPQGIAYDPVTKVLAVAVRKPDRLLLLDPTTLRQRTSVQLPGKARHVKLGRPGGPVLVPDETSNRLFQVSLTTGRTTSTEVLRHPHDAVLTEDGDVIVGNEFTHSLSVVRDGKQVATKKDFVRPGGLATDGNVLAALDEEAFTLSTYALPSLRRTARVPAGAGPTHAAITTGHREVVVDTRAGRLRVFDLDPLEQRTGIRLGGTPYGIDTDLSTGTVWVTLTARNEVVGVDLSGARPRVIASYPTVRQPDTVAVAPGGHTLWVTGTAGDEIERITR